MRKIDDFKIDARTTSLGEANEPELAYHKLFWDYSHRGIAGSLVFFLVSTWRDAISTLVVWQYRYLLRLPSAANPP
jgi:hypothetical protein